MNKNYIRYLIITILFISLPAFARQNVKRIIEKVQDKYEDADNFSADFVQVEKFSLTGSVNQTSGKIYVKDGVKYRLETEDRIIVTDGKTTWSYSYLRNQVIIDHMKEGDAALLPRDLLFKLPRQHYATLLDEEEIYGKEYYVVKLDPKEEVKGYIKTMKIWVEQDTYLIRKIEYTDFNDNPTTFAIKSQDHDTKLSDDFFHFKAPEDSEIVDFR